MIDAHQLEVLHRTLFKNPSDSICAVLDGCLVEGIVERLRVSGCEHSCLFSGQLDPVLAAAAPYLVRLQAETHFTMEVLREGWNAHWGIVLRLPEGADFLELRHHLRRFLRITGPGGKPFFFRYYDPRALRSVLPSLKCEAFREFMGPILGIYAEGSTPDCMVHFSPADASDAMTIPLPRGVLPSTELA